MKLLPLLLFGVLCSCQRTLSPAAYLTAPPVKGRVLIPMDGAIAVKRTTAWLDSAALVHKVLVRALKDERNRVEMVVYYNGAGPLDMRIAGAIGFSLKNLLIREGYPEARLSYYTKFYVPPAGAQLDSYQKIDFIITRRSKGASRE